MSVPRLCYPQAQAQAADEGAERAAATLSGIMITTAFACLTLTSHMHINSQLGTCFRPRLELWVMAWRGMLRQ